MRYAMNNLLIEKLTPGGQGIGTLPDGKKIFLWNALPNEEITEFEILKNKKSYAIGVASKIAKKSPHRIEPKDPCYLSTSPWQVMDYDYELEQKLVLLQEQFRQAQIDSGDEQNPVVTDNHDFYYRNKMEYSLYWDHASESIKLAFHQRGSHRKIPITKSSLERPEIFTKAQQIVDNLNARHEEARKYQSLLLRCDQQGNVHGGLYENHQPHPQFAPLTDTILSHQYSYSPNGFFQINLPVYEMALTEIKKHITTNKVLDLYSGVGTIGLSVARDRELKLVECDKAAYAELEKNVEMLMGQGFAARDDGRNEDRLSLCDDRETAVCPCHSNISTFLSKSEDALNHIAPDQTVIVDPPRAGCHVKLLERLLDQKPPTIIYLSCNPATQARDLKILEKFYQIQQITPFNFFPRTPHLENLAILQLR